MSVKPIEVQLTLHTDRNMGDHGEMHRVALESTRDLDLTLREIIGQAVEVYPSFARHGSTVTLKPGDVIEIRTLPVPEV